MVKDLGEELENLEESVENLKNKEFRIFGIKMTAMTISAAGALVGSVIGALYGAFVIYADYMSMKEIILNIDVAAIDAKNELIETKLDDAVSYTKICLLSAAAPETLTLTRYRMSSVERFATVSDEQIACFPAGTA